MVMVPSTKDHIPIFILEKCGNFISKLTVFSPIFEMYIIIYNRPLGYWTHKKQPLGNCHPIIGNLLVPCAIYHWGTLKKIFSLFLVIGPFE